MAVPVVEGSGTHSLNNGTTISIQVTGVTDNELLVAVVVKEATTAFNSAPSGWTIVRNDTIGTGATGRCWVAYKIASSEGTDPTYTWTWTGNEDGGGRVYRISGVNTTTPVDQTSTNSGNSNNPVATSVTTDEADNLVLAIHVTPSSNLNGMSNDTGWTLLHSEAYGSGGDVTSAINESKEVDSAASGNTSQDGAGGSYDWHAFQLAIQPGAGSNALTASGTVELTGSASLDIGTRLIASGTVELTGATSLDIGTRLTASGTVEFTGTADLTAKSINALAASGTVEWTGAAPLKLDHQFAASGTVELTGSGDMDIGTRLSASGTHEFTGSGSLDIGTRLTASGTAEWTGSADFDVATRLTASGTVEWTGSGTLTNEEGTQGSNPLTASGTAEWTGSGALTVTLPGPAQGSASEATNWRGGVSDAGAYRGGMTQAGVGTAAVSDTPTI